MIRPLLKIKLIICSALLINNPIKTTKAAQYQNCYECTFTCFTKQYYDCLNQENPNYLCQQNIACCTGDNLDKYIESKSCDRSCQTSWIYKKSDSSTSFLSIRRSCMDTNHLHQDGKIYQDRYGYIEDTNCNELCEDYCFCAGEKCNDIESKNDCKSIFSNPATNALFFLLSVLVIVYILVETVIKWYLVTRWKNKLADVGAGMYSHGMGYED